jgi:hypothetical protein
MSEPTNAQIAEQEDMRLDGQIAELMEARADTGNLPDPPEEAPDPEPPEDPHWWDDPDEVVAFARWYWQGALNFIGSAGEILDYFEKPWHFDEEYEEGFLAQKVKVI